jgi:amino acid adenylation domain-containing protein
VTDLPAQDPPLTTLVELVARTTERLPNAAAVSDDDTQVSYAELAARSDALAGVLADHGVRAGDHVALFLTRGVDAVAAVIGVLKAGAAYLPIDTQYPPARRNQMIATGRVRCIVASPGLGERLDNPPAEVLEWSGEDWPHDEPVLPVPPPRPEDAACVLFTSGSTGEPKGIVLEHRQIAWFASTDSLPTLQPGDRTAQASSVGFDTFTFEVWRTLAGGAEIAVTPPFRHLLSGDLGRELRRRRITAMLAPAVAVNHVVRYDRDAFASLKLLCSGGDVLLPSTCRELLAGGFAGRFFNLYGPTETTVACTGYEVTEATVDGDTVPIGHALDGAELYVLDGDMRQVPDGEPGELYVGGAGVARGYLDRPGLTTERFVLSPFDPEGRLYRTGDRVRRRPEDGALEYLGRTDNQVKIGGLRVEPAEIEREIRGFGWVEEAAVAAVGDDDRRRLVAFLVPAGQLVLRELRKYLGERLPEQLVPHDFVVLDAMPTDSHGKRDSRQLLQAHEDRNRARSDYVEPGDDVERYLAGLWEDLLVTERVGSQDDFFALGGHSLLAVRARVTIRKDLGVSLNPETLFEHSVLEELAAAIRAAHRSADDSAGAEVLR